MNNFVSSCELIARKIKLKEIRKLTEWNNGEIIPFFIFGQYYNVLAVVFYTLFKLQIHEEFLMKYKESVICQTELLQNFMSA